MNKSNLCKLTKVSALAIASSIVAVGCSKSEAERFGYKGEDLLEPTNITYLVLSPTVTNWVPERVLTIYENYELTEDEKNVVKLAGVVMPGAEYTTLPEGYECDTKEPWFSLMTRKTKSFGYDGVAGILTHRNDDRNLWETSESYFSSYWKTKEEALVALSNVEKELSEKCNVKKFHKFTDCWIAEYVRLSVLGVVGQKADGTWSCMLSIRDKNRYGCGVWIPVEEQQTRLNRYNYMKEVRAWRKVVSKLMKDNSELVAKRATEKGYIGFTNNITQVMNDDDRMAIRSYEELPALKKEDDAEKIAEKAWNECIAQVKKNLGVEFKDEIKKDVGEDKTIRWCALSTSDLYKVSVELFVQPYVEPVEGETRTYGGYCEVTYAEALQPEIKLPPQPELKE